jgi:outer membrane receptor protein involved in Fe transport
MTSLVRTVAMLTMALLSLARPAGGQTALPPLPTGRIVGRIIDASNGAGLTDVGIQLVGTTLGTNSGLDGRFSIAGVPAGTVAIQVRRIGFAPKTVTGIFLDPGMTLEQNVALETATVQLAAQVVTASAERGSVNAALDEQRNATNVVNSVTAEQIARSPDGDAAAAAQRVSGVTVQDGKYVSVRGLGERYTTTSLNGARLPSPDPERKVVPLDLFPASLLQSVTTSKTFTPDQPGDFGGAEVNLRTREFPAERQVTYSMSTGYNTRTTGRAVLAAPREGFEWLGFAAGPRRLPGIVAAAGNFSTSPSQADYNAMVTSFRNDWTVRERTGSPNTSVGISVGGDDPVFGRRIGYVGALTYSYTQEVRTNEVRAYPIPESDGATREIDRFEGTTGRTSVLWGGLFNLSTLVGRSSRIALNNTFSRTADNEAHFEEGSEENVGFPLQISRLQYAEGMLWSSQLTGEHQLADAHRIGWSFTGSRVTRQVPDRAETVYAIDAPGTAPFLFGSEDGAKRTFADLTEFNYSPSADYSFRFGNGDNLFKIGGLGRYTRRDADNPAYGILANSLPREDRERPAEEIFDGRFADPGSAVYRVVPLSQGGSYGATDWLGAGYGMMEYQLGSRVRLIGGARVEYSMLDISVHETFGNPVFVTKTYTDVLPSAAANVGLTDDQTLRLSLSQTLARPEYREVVPINQQDVRGEQFRGNIALRRTLIQNADVRWEWYPSSGEVISVGVFAKRFDDPIERIYRGTSGTRITTYENAESAISYGAELELRKQLGFIAASLAPVTVFSNATVIRSEVDLKNVSAGSVESNRPMVGQAPYVVNAGATYAAASGSASATILYNVVGRSVFAASLLPLPNVYEQPRQTIDLALRVPVRGSLSLKIDGRNLLDAESRVTQGVATRESYRTGRVISAGLTWKR